MSDIIIENINSLKKELSNFLTSDSDFLILCLGNELRGDDALGVLIGNNLITKIPNLSDKIIIAHNAPVNFIGKITRLHPSRLLIIDSIDMNLKPGIIGLFEAGDVKNTSSTSTHYQDLDDLIRFIQYENDEVPSIRILGIQIMNMELNSKISADVKISIDKIISLIYNIFND